MLKRRSSFIIMAMVIFVLVFTTACSNDKPSGDTNADSGSDNEKVYTLRYAHDHMPDSPFQKSAEDFKDVVEEKSEGRIKVDIYPAEQVGAGREVLEALQLGSVEMINMPVAFFAGFDIKYSLVDMPFLFPNEDVLFKALEGDIGKQLLDLSLDKDMKGIAFYAEGWRQMTNNKPIRTSEDMKGLKIRAMNAPIILEQYKAWGANPVTLDYSEVYNALQQGVVEGQENPLLSINDKKFYEVQDYLILSDHNYLSYVLYANNTWFESLPKDLQEIVYDAGVDIAKEHRVRMDEANAGYLKTIKESGIEVITLTDQEKQDFRKASEAVYEKYKDEFGDILDETIKFVEENK